MSSSSHPNLGATVIPGGTAFCVWAPRPATIALEIIAPEPALYPLERDACGMAAVSVPGLGAGARYGYRLDGIFRPDPASRLQPLGVHGVSEVVAVAPLAERHPCWTGPPLARYVFYELHVGTFTEAGDFDGVTSDVGGDLERLRDLGVTAVELMPVAQFPGRRNWGYDGVYPFAAQESYGGPAGLLRLVDACHRLGLAVVLDVVYNHLGPEGNYFAAYAPYFTEKYRTPWGEALNFDGAESDRVRDFFIQNALYWLRDVGVDALRLDAIHGIFDASAVPFLADLSAAVEAEAARSSRNLYLIAESDLNDVRVLRPRAVGGFGMPAQWNDDFHHAAHALLTGERDGYYADFSTVADLAAAVRQGFVYDGRYSVYRRRRHGNSAAGIARDRFVVCMQNHDQVGNRTLGDRLSAELDFESLKLAAGLLLLSPNLPLLFMGEEYGETAPFAYFIDHGDPKIVEAVRRGRRQEFHPFGWDEIPDPADPATFEAARLRRDQRLLPRHAALERLYRELLRKRPALGGDIEVWSQEQPPLLTWRRGKSFAAFNFSREIVAIPLPAGGWRLHLDSAASAWLGPGAATAGTLAPRSFALFMKI